MSTPIVSAPSEEVAALHAQVRHYESELTERDAVIAQRDAMIEHLQEQVRLLLARRFAPSSEKIPDGQLGLFNEAEATEAEEPESAPGTEVGAHRRGTPKRAPIPQALPHKRCRASTSSIGCPKMNAPARITAWSSSASPRW